ncbi:LytR C-terminal domain-containing protein [Gulosibacter chungangensis]|uniref:LytR family transcriptional regulator n=1 Tax=Gulosibacter chungangensis TaxID=979746 RepID=A0A7J5BAN8_9MICO|nr:LytR C-terminal domain-containing protein [Gulosibacter chungangensis]KAB1643115.1 LytR family transcriptional regulator [Gulosibacter chungangensis]
MKYPKDRFDDFPASLKRRGAHRAPRGRGSKLASWLIALASFVLLVGIGVGVMWMIDRQVQFTSQAGDEATTETTPAATEEPETTPTPTEPEATQDPNISVTVLNGAGVGGLAGATSDLLTGDSWNVVTVSDADSADYSTTIVAVGSEADLGAALGVVETLGFGEAQVDPQIANAGEIVVIAGADAASLVNG